MIVFACSQCREELEADEEIKGTRMKCPACWKEIEVPKTGLRPGRRKEFGGRSASRASPSRRGAWILGLLIGGILALSTLLGIGLYLHSHRAEATRVACSSCEGAGMMVCPECRGEERVSCKTCKGTGQRENVREEKESCLACGGTRLLSCPRCGGRGKYSCAECGGEGRIDSGKANPE